MSDRTKKFSEELDELIREGEFLAMAIEYDCKPEQFRRCYIKVFKDDDEKLEAFIKKLPRSYAQKLVTVRLGGVLKLLDPVFELNPLNDFGQSICAAELSPFLLG